MGVWDEIAEQWSKFRRKPIPELEEFHRKYVSKPGKILDIGCGNCRNLLPFGFKGYELYGIDKSAKMIEQAQLFTSEYNLKVSLEVGDMVSLPYPDNFFDYVLSLAALHHLRTPARRKRAVQEMYRVLKRGGIARVSVWQELHKEESFVKWGELKRYYYKFPPKELRRLLEATGFNVLESYVGRNLIFVVQK